MCGEVCDENEFNDVEDKECHECSSDVEDCE